MAIALWYCPQYGSPAYETLELLIISLQSVFPSSRIFEPHLTIATNLACNDVDDVNKILTSCVAAMRSIRPRLRSAGGSGGMGRDGGPSNTRSSSDESGIQGTAEGTSVLVSFRGCSVGRRFLRKVALECNENRYLHSIAQIMREVYVEIDDSSRSQRAATWARDEFAPHVSLLYSDVYPISQAFLRIIQQRIEDVLDTPMHKLDPLKDNISHSNEKQVSWEFDRTPALSWSLPGTFKVVKCEGPVEDWQVLGRTDV
ncbi:hypothetical protein HG535_0E00980 [Zygotorulaspora mrakii]|uniref:2',3'-cyclic-nucleotide 3'-phosphodiesterase n=1 Tax=Zygotorulaspora mrakii TaxID=42260 RepID=A0A7H9B3N4_ZYGMR|nr:uncharacterized protein HG535_0E00980 [Zygotorulaspora mrakii]QLG73014.1 hypothetical protein HG535_0E00980 [Zygotorulaspora mrakii]